MADSVNPLEADSRDFLDITPTELLVQNVKLMMKHRGVSRTSLRERMDRLGHTTWRHERTVRNVLNGERKVTVDELIGLALALQTTIEVLLRQGLQSAIEGTLQVQGSVIVAGPDVGPVDWLGPIVTNRAKFAMEPEDAAALARTRLEFDEAGKPVKWRTPERDTIARATENLRRNARELGIAVDETMTLQELANAIQHQEQTR